MKDRRKRGEEWKERKQANQASRFACVARHKGKAGASCLPWRRLHCEAGLGEQTFDTLDVKVLFKSGRRAHVPGDAPAEPASLGDLSTREQPDHSVWKAGTLAEGG